MQIVADTFGSDYDTTLAVYTGEPGALSQIACNNDARGTLQSQVRFHAFRQQTYFFMIGAPNDVSGGDLVFNVAQQSDEPPHVAKEHQIECGEGKNFVSSDSSKDQFFVIRVTDQCPGEDSEIAVLDDTGDVRERFSVPDGDTRIVRTLVPAGGSVDILCNGTAGNPGNRCTATVRFETNPPGRGAMLTPMYHQVFRHNFACTNTGASAYEPKGSSILAHHTGGAVAPVVSESRDTMLVR
jgi:hypothetical protein